MYADPQIDMKHSFVSSFGLTVLVGCAFITPALASLVSIDYVTIGNPGSGSVGYEYNIGKYEVTNSQYAAFLNAKGSSNSYGIYNSYMAPYGITQSGSSGSFTYSVTPGMENRPVVMVSWYDAARFTNWLGNGQGSADMENGAYTLNGNEGMPVLNPGAAVWLPTDNEWNKAAYYNGATSSYSLYANGQDTLTIDDANISSINPFSLSTRSVNVGSYINDPSAYGTFDQAGNVAEWTSSTLQRGGSWRDLDSATTSTSSFSIHPLAETDLAGFRVASVPEPSSAVFVMLASGMLLTRRKR